MEKLVVRAEEESETEFDVIIRFTVSDTGIGISELAQRKTFSGFHSG